ncbi:MAG: hypothetical protein Q3962_05795 [Corynebacterium sp.]|nr:hypothetical protein [Corynebacterium sp.]
MAKEVAHNPETENPIEAVTTALKKAGVTLHPLDKNPDQPENVEILGANINGFIYNFWFIDKALMVARVQVQTDRPTDSPDPSYYLQCVPFNSGPFGVSVSIVDSDATPATQAFQIEHEFFLGTPWFDSQLMAVVGQVFNAASTIATQLGEHCTFPKDWVNPAQN